MSATLYWKSRLTDGDIFFTEASRIVGSTVKPHKNKSDLKWPYAVARSAIYEDYCVWHRLAYLPTFADVEHYKNFPEDLPERADELGFFSTIGPWLYMVGKQRQVRSYSVDEPVHQFGAWHEAKKKRYFVRLCSLAAHRAAFALYTGSVVETQVSDEELIRVVTEAQTESRDRIERNRASMPTMS